MKGETGGKFPVIAPEARGSRRKPWVKNVLEMSEKWRLPIQSREDSQEPGDYP